MVVVERHKEFTDLFFVPPPCIASGLLPVKRIKFKFKGDKINLTGSNVNVNAFTARV